MAQRDMDFNKMASRYDGAGGRASGVFYRLLVGQVELTEGAKVLDVRCGTGALLRMMADKRPIDGYGVDISENMITEAKRKCPEMNIQVSRSEKTPFDDASFDIVTACMAYHHFSDRAGFVAETMRILKPGGRVYIADPNFPFIVRKAINGFFKAIRVAGAMNTPEEIHRDFAARGFIADGFVKSGVAQVVKMKKKAG